MLLETLLPRVSFGWGRNLKFILFHERRNCCSFDTSKLIEIRNQIHQLFILSATSTHSIRQSKLRFYWNLAIFTWWINTQLQKVDGLSKTIFLKAVTVVLKSFLICSCIFTESQYWLIKIFCIPKVICSHFSFKWIRWKFLVIS